MANQKALDEHPEVLAFRRYAFRLLDSAQPGKASGALYGPMGGNQELQNAYRKLLTARNVALAARLSDEVGNTTVGALVSKYIETSGYDKLLRKTCEGIETQYFPGSQEAGHLQGAASFEEFLNALTKMGEKHAERFRSMLSEVTTEHEEAFQVALQESYATTIRALMAACEQDCAKEATRLQAQSDRLYSDLWKEYEALPVNSPERQQIAQLLSNR